METSFGLKKSNGVLRKEHFIPGAIQLNDRKVTDPNEPLHPSEGDILRMSKKHAVRFGA
jgi:tyrosyl-tRNA synthetase